MEHAGSAPVDASRQALRIGNTELRRRCGVVFVNGAALPMGRAQVAVLELLLQSPRKTMTKTEFVEHLYGDAAAVDDRAIDVFVSRLRKRLALVNSDIDIRTVRGQGYMLTVAQADEAAAPEIGTATFTAGLEAAFRTATQDAVRDALDQSVPVTIASRQERQRNTPPRAPARSTP